MCTVYDNLHWRDNAFTNVLCPYAYQCSKYYDSEEIHIMKITELRNAVLYINNEQLTAILNQKKNMT